jgi:hypothetical protein
MFTLIRNASVANGRFRYLDKSLLNSDFMTGYVRALAICGDTCSMDDELKRSSLHLFAEGACHTCRSGRVTGQGA